MGRSKPVAIDLFCGAGGFSLGAHRAGFHVALAVDIDPRACATYERNLVKRGITSSLCQGDLNEIEPQHLERFDEELVDGCDLVIGGPPCQGFSTHRINNSGVDDPRNRLLLRYFDFVSYLNPSYFVIENVPGILWPRHRDWLEKLYSIASERGYAVSSPAEINAADYGVPQRRKRVFIVGRRRDVESIPFPPARTHAAPSENSRLKLRSWESAADAFVRPKFANDPNDIHMNHSRELREAFERTPHNGGSRKDSGRTLPCHENHSGHSDVYGRIDPRMPAPTMTTACINPSKGRFVHPTEPHGITIRQAARLQTFPDWFVFEGGLMSAGTQIGNAVPPLLAQVLLTPISDNLRAAAFNASAVAQRGG